MTKYIDNNKNKGIEIDYKKVENEFNKLKIPNDIFNPINIFKKRNVWNVLLSERSMGKTTNIILLGLVLNKIYGIIPQYVRRTKDMCMPKNIKNMMDVIINFGYIKKLTDNRYNTMIYKARRWYYANVDSDGKVLEISERHCIMVLCLSESEMYKSTYNAPTGDMIIFDEFITNKYYLENEFILFCDLLKTILRDRLSGRIFLLANTLNKHCPYFSELGINKEVLKNRVGQHFTKITDKGTSIYFEMLENGSKKNIIKRISNSKYFGLENPMLNMITNGEWQIDNYPHPFFNNKNDTLITQDIFIDFNTESVQCELYASSTMGVYVIVHPYTFERQIFNNTIIYTDEVKNEKNYKYGIPTGLFVKKIDRIFWNCYNNKAFYYSDNDVGDIVKNFVATFGKKC